jgi:hypothetical protein
MPTLPGHPAIPSASFRVAIGTKKAVVVRFSVMDGESTMKLNTQTHPKFRGLAKALKLKQFEAVGVLESLWMMACQFAGDDGDLSRFTPQEIADWMDWTRDAEGLIQALIEHRWLDSDGGSLSVHDWQDHKPHYLKDRERKKTPGTSRNAPGTSEPSQANSSQANSSQVDEGAAKRFVSPSVQDVREFAKTEGLKIDAEGFVNFYSSKGWMVGKNKMKDWRAAARRAKDWTSSTTQQTTQKEPDFVN